MLHINIANKIAKYQVRDGDIVCDNTGYKVAFTFDSEWDGHAERTARFIWNGAYKDVDIVDEVLDGETIKCCEVPKIIDATEVFVGVYAGEMKTTTDARIPCVKSVLSRTSVGQPDQVKEYRDQAGIYADEAEASAAEARAAASTAASEASSAAAASVAAKAEEMISDLGIVQEAGDSSTSVMSQVASSTAFANALKGTAQGEVVRLTDVSPVPHRVKVKVKGKNLIPPVPATKTQNGTTYVVGTDGGVTVDVTPTSGFHLTVGKWTTPITLKGTYTLSVGTALPKGSYFWIKDTQGGNAQLLTYSTAGATSRSFELDGEYVELLLWVSIDGTYNNHKFYPQLEEGTTATEYEPYIDPTSVTVTAEGNTYTPNADGTVDGVVSVSPTMTLLTDTAGVTIEVEYNQDTEKAVQRGVSEALVEIRAEGEPSRNLFNKNTVTRGAYVYPQTGAITENASFCYSDLIPIEKGKTYSFVSDFGNFGSTTGKMLAGYDADGNYIAKLVGASTGATVDGNQKTTICTITIPDADGNDWAFVRTSLRLVYLDTHMFVEGTEYPTEYIPYGDSPSTLNEDIHLQEMHTRRLDPLYGKKLSCNGDSICAGAGASGGYASIIGEMYNMTVQNIGVNGGTITAEVYKSDGVTARHWICRTIENMDADSDYVIVEGGVNDSSIGVPLGAITADYGDTLDESTFYGAFESMLKQLLTRFAGKKVGYIAVHQMSLNFRANNEKETSYYWAARLCCEKWGVPFLDLNTTVPPLGLIRDVNGQKELYANTRALYTYNADGWHPNEEGYKKYYVPKIVAWMKTL